MFWKKTQVKDRSLDGCCTKNQQIEMYRELYAKAAKERDEARAQAKLLSDALDIALDTMRITVQEFTQMIEAAGEVEARLRTIKNPREGDAAGVDWIKDPQEATP